MEKSSRGNLWNDMAHNSTDMCQFLSLGGGACICMCVSVNVWPFSHLSLKAVGPRRAAFVNFNYCSSIPYHMLLFIICVSMELSIVVSPGHKKISIIFQRMNLNSRAKNSIFQCDAALMEIWWYNTPPNLPSSASFTHLISESIECK